MTKGKKWTLRLLGVAALALLICLCLLGSTMARYTSSGVGSGSLTVAIWDLETATPELTTEAISPSDDEYSTETAREHESTYQLAFQMVNNSAVDATVTVELGIPEGSETVEIGLKWADDFTWGIGWTGEDDIEYDGTDIKYDTNGNTIPVSGRAQTNAYAKDLMAKFGFTASGTASEIDASCKAQFISLVNAWGVFSIELATDAEGSDAAESQSFTLDAGVGEYKGDNSTKDIYAGVLWTSVCQANASSSATIPDGFKADETATNAEWVEFSDAVDTILGMYVTTLSFTVTWSAYQASTLPPAEQNP